MKKILLIFLSVFLFSLPLLAQEVDTAWVRRYNGPGNMGDEAHAIAVDDSGNVYVTGWSSDGRIIHYNDFLTIKYSSNGETDWIRRFNGAENSVDKPFSLAVDDSGNVYVTGISFNKRTLYDYCTIKYHPNGDTAWVRSYNGSGNTYECAYDVAVDHLGNVYVTGESNKDYTTVKYNPQGDEIWVRKYNGPGDSVDIASAIAVDRSGDIYVTGNSIGLGTDFDYCTVKYYPNGDTAWVRRYNGPGDESRNSDYVSALTVDNSSNVYVTGGSWGDGTRRDYATIKYYSNGDTAWVRRYNFEYDTVIAMTGSENPYGLGKESLDHATAIAVDNFENVYVTGYCGWMSNNFVTIKYNVNGDTVWVRNHRGHSSTMVVASPEIALDNSGNVYVTGCSGDRQKTRNLDYLVIKYDQEGVEEWVCNYNGPGDKIDKATAIAVDSLGNVYVTGWSEGEGTSFDYATIKYVQKPPEK